MSKELTEDDIIFYRRQLEYASEADYVVFGREPYDAMKYFATFQFEESLGVIIKADTPAELVARVCLEIQEKGTLLTGKP